MTRRSCHRGAVLFVVMGVVAGGALVGSTILLMADARRESSAASVGRIETRAIAWSGVQAVMSQLADQREQLLTGESPEIESELVLFESEDGAMSVVRLIPIGPDGELFVPEAGKLDINHASPEMLAEISGITGTIAGRIAGAAPYASVHDLIDIEGITPALLYGGGSGDTFGNADAALVDRLTVFSFDPNVVAGFGDNEEYTGTRRFNLNTQWSESFKDALDQRFDDGAGDAIKQVLDRGYSFETDAGIVRVLVEIFEADTDTWIEILDALTTTDDQYMLGRVDINRASEEVLAAIPGLDSVAARRIVDQRDLLSDQMRRTPVWPVVEEIIDTESFYLAVDHMTTRTLQWRVRLEAGVIPPGTDAPIADEFGMLTEQAFGIGGEMEDLIVVEAVIDLSSRRPRIAELYDVTLVDPLRALAARTPEPQPEMMSFDSLATVELGDLDPVADSPDRVALDFGDLEVVEPMDQQQSPGAGRVTLDPMEAVDRRIGRWRFGTKEQR